MLSLDNPIALLGLILLPSVYFLYSKTLRVPVLVPSVLLWRKAGGSRVETRGVERKFDIRPRITKDGAMGDNQSMTHHFRNRGERAKIIGVERMDSNSSPFSADHLLGKDIEKDKRK